MIQSMNLLHIVQTTYIKIVKAIKNPQEIEGFCNY